MYQSSTDSFKFAPSMKHDDHVDNQANETNETHYSGGIKIVEKMRAYDENNQHAGSLEKHEYKEHEEKVVPFSLFYERPSKIRCVGGITNNDDNDNDDVPVISENMHDKLFYSVSQEINEKGNRKTRKHTIPLKELSVEK